MKARFAQPEYEEILAELPDLGLDQSEFLRRAARYALQHKDAVLADIHQEVTAKAS